MIETRNRESLTQLLCPAGPTHAETGRRFSTLTPREREVMALVAEGKPNKVTAARLCVSTRTVEIHRASVMAKMKVKSIAELVRLAIFREILAA